MTVGERIKEIRKAQGITQKRLASFLGVTPALIAHYENGVRYPKFSTLVEIADALNADLEEFMKYYDSRRDAKGKGKRQLGDLVFLPGGIPGVERYMTPKDYILEDLEKLNEEGQKAAAARIRELTEIPRYKKDGEAE